MNIPFFAAPRNNKIRSSGFTVLELLIILGIITILIGLVLISLNAARHHSNDERRIATIKTVALGLQNYFNICRQYPVNLVAGETCSVLAPKTLVDVIPEAVPLDVNGPLSKYHYESLVINDPRQPNTECTNFHLWVELESDGASFASQRSSKTVIDHTAANLNQCFGNSATPISAPDPKIFDIFK